MTGTFFKLVDGDAGQSKNDEPVTSEAFHACSLQNGCANVLAASTVHKQKSDKSEENSDDSPSGKIGDAAWRKIEFLGKSC